MVEGKHVTLTIEAGHPTTELYLIDADRRLVTRGLGRIESMVSPGIYTVKARAGNALVERLVVIPPGITEHVETIPELEFQSAAPLEGASRAAEDHGSSAKLLSERIEVDKGAGSEIFICARTIDERSPSLTFGRFAVLDGTGAELVDVLALTKAARGEKPDTVVGCTVSLDAGPYRVAYRVGEGPEVEQSIVAADGWQTQLFMLQTPATNTTLFGIPEISILMGRKGFEPAEKSSRWAELARQALVARRAKLAAELAVGHEDRITNPMTGIYLLHLLVLANVPHARIEKVLRQVRELVTDHPDVEIVAQHIGRRRAHTGFAAPPMLRHSWELLLTASVKDARLVPADSLSAEVAPRIVAVDPWLTWTAAAGGRNLQAELKKALKVSRTMRADVPQAPEPAVVASPVAADAEPAHAGVSVRSTSAMASSAGAVNNSSFGATPQRDLVGGQASSPPAAASKTARRASTTTTSASDETARLVDTLQLPRSTVEGLLRSSKRST